MDQAMPLGISGSDMKQAMAQRDAIMDAAKVKGPKIWDKGLWADSVEVDASTLLGWANGGECCFTDKWSEAPTDHKTLKAHWDLQEWMKGTVKRGVTYMNSLGAKQVFQDKKEVALRTAEDGAENDIGTCVVKMTKVGSKIRCTFSLYSEHWKEYDNTHLNPRCELWGQASMNKYLMASMYKVTPAFIDAAFDDFHAGTRRRSEVELAGQTSDFPAPGMRRRQDGQ